MAFPPLLVGAWAWGDKKFWAYGSSGPGPEGVASAFVEATSAGLTYIDTAEVYGDGESEKIVGWLVRKSGLPIQVTTKFGLLPGRPGARVLRRALEASLARLRLPSIEMYQVHWPDRTMASVEELMDAMADVCGAGLCRGVGVSNFSGDEMLRAHEALQKRGLRLLSNQVRYSLVFRSPERDGVLDACRQIGASLLAYSPLEQGVLSGKYLDAPAPPGKRGGEPWFSPERLGAVRPVVGLLREVGRRYERTAAQVALRWLCQQPGVVPIVGLTSGEQAREAAGVLSFSLSADEQEAIGAAGGNAEGRERFK